MHIKPYAPRFKNYFFRQRLNPIHRTFSRDVREKLKDSNPLSALSANPQILLKFVRQAVQNQEYLRSELKLFSISLSMVLRQALSGILPLSQVIKASIVMTRFTGTMPIGDIFFFHNNERSPAVLHRLFMMPYCSRLKDIWLKDPFKMEFSLAEVIPVRFTDEFAKNLIHKYLLILYSTFFTSDFARFYNLEKSEIYILIKLCQGLGYEKGEIELQRLFCKKINSIDAALENMAFSKANNLPIIMEFCRKYLDEVDLHFTAKTKLHSYFALTVYPKEAAYPNQDLQTYTKGFLAYGDTVQEKSLIIKIWNFTTLMISCRRAVSVEISTVEAFNSGLRSDTKAKPLKMKDLHLEHLLASGTNSTTSSAFAGLSLYFSKVVNTGFVRFDVLPDSYIKQVSIVRPDIFGITLSIMMCPLTSAFIQNIGNHFKNLMKVCFLFANLSKDNLSEVLKINSLVHLELSKTTFELPDNLQLFARLRQIELIHSDCLSRTDLLRLFSAAVNVRCLVLQQVSQMKLGDYPLPHNILEIAGDFESIYQERQSLRLFCNLQSIKFFGKCDQRLPELLVYLRYGMRTHFEFLGA